jgi:hypothetical protein
VRSQVKAKLTDQQQNAVISLEATQNVEALLAFNLGGPVSGTWSGTITSTGWTLNFSGSIDGQTTQLTETGTINKKGTDATWEDTGSVGATPVTGSGSAIYKSDWLTWSQTVQGGSTGQSAHGDLYFYDPIATYQEEVCYSDGPTSTECEAAENWSWFEEFGPEINYTAVARLDTTTGYVFSSGDTEDNTFVIVHVGNLSFSTGSVSYVSTSFNPASGS